MGDLLTLHIAKISKSIKSCQTFEQLVVCKTIIRNFTKYWECKHANPVFIQKCISYFLTLYNLKRRHIRHE